MFLKSEIKNGKIDTNLDIPILNSNYIYFIQFFNLLYLFKKIWQLIMINCSYCHHKVLNITHI